MKSHCFSIACRAILAAVFLFTVVPGRISAKEPTPSLAEKLPGGAIGFAEISELGSVIGRFRKSAYLDVIVKSALFRELAASDGYLKAQAGRQIAEVQLGTDLWTLAGKMFSDRVAVGVYVTEGKKDPDIVGLLRVEKAATLSHLRERVEPLLVLASEQIDRSETLEGVEVLSIGGEAFLATKDDWIAVSSSRDLLGKSLELLSGKDAPALASDENFAGMVDKVGSDHLVCAYVNTETIRNLSGGRFVPTKLDNALGSLLIGGAMELIGESPYGELHVDIGEPGFLISASVAGETANLGEAHRAFFSDPRGPGTEPIPATPTLIGGLTIYRDFVSWYRHREDLLEDQALPGFDKFESGLAGILAGMDFGSDILTLIGQRLTLVSARQKYDHLEGRPGIEFPGFALVVDLANPREGAKMFRLFFQTLSALLNIQAGQQGRQPWVMTSESYKGLQISYGEYLKKPTGERLDFVFNFMPASVRVGNKFILSTSIGLCRDLVDQLQAPPAKEKLPNRNFNFEVEADAVADMLEVNAEFFHAQSIKSGSTQEEAEAKFSTILKLVRYFDAARLSSNVKPDGYCVNLEVNWK